MPTLTVISLTCRSCSNLIEMDRRSPSARSQTKYCFSCYLNHKRDSNSRAVKACLTSTRDKAIASRGGACEECGFSDCRALQFDHINGDGQKERTTSAKHRMYREITAGARPDIQLLCANCHSITTQVRFRGSLP